MLFPIVIQDNFFEDPDFIVNYANKLKYEENVKKAPGLRTKPIHQFDQEFFFLGYKQIFKTLLSR